MFLQFWDWIILMSSVLLFLYLWMNYNYGEFERRGVKTRKPTVPFLGNLYESLFQKEHYTESMKIIYHLHPEEKYVGYYELMRGIIMLRDIELIKKICIKDFDHFQDHRRLVKTDDSIFTKHLFALRGQKWRDMRATLSPAFTSSKMRSMFLFVIECAEDLINYYKKQSKESGKEEIAIEMKDAFTRYTNDVIATCAFGLKVDSLNVQDNEFYLMGKKLSNFSGRTLLKFMGYSIAPRIMKFLRFTIFDKSLTIFFRNLVQDTMKDREEKHIVREDMIHLLMEAKKGSLKHELQTDKQDAGFATAEDSYVEHALPKTEWTDDDLTAQVLLFFAAGFDTSSTLLSFLSVELSHNPDVQERLQAEVDAVRSGLHGKLNYNDLQKLKYLDMVISETLRKWPPAPATDRACAKSYTLPPPNEFGKEYKLEKLDSLWIPIFAIHHDPAYYDNPEKFDPERFSDENKGKIKPYTYLPFGIGPRNCIGSRFALMEVKAIVFYLLSNFNFVSHPKTEYPIVLSKNTLVLKPKDGFWINLKSRKVVT